MPILEPDEFETGNWAESYNFGSFYSSGAEIIVNLFSELSRHILSNSAARTYSDLMTFGYFCRKASLSRALASVSALDKRFGWGTVVHISPSNIPINFSYSLVMGLLSGNSCIVRLPSKRYPQNDLLLDIFGQVIEKSEFEQVR
ncbi:MAG: acyl-CoA reductase, partial [Gammaproteobacteria bacterium]